MTNEDKKKIIFIILAVVVGLVTAVLVGNHIQTELNKKTQELARDFEKNVKPLQQEVVSLRQELVDTKKNLAQQIVAAAAKAAAEQPKAAAAVAAAPPPVASLAIKTPAGKRALTVQIDSLSAVGGLINPGDYVDVLARLNVPRETVGGAGGPAEQLTAMVFQNIQVLAIGTNLSTPGMYDAQNKAGNLYVTLAMDPEEAGLMSFVQQNGKVQLALRSPSETQSYLLQASSWQTLSDYLLEKQGTAISAPRTKTTLEPAAEEVKPYIQIFRGGREL